MKSATRKKSFSLKSLEVRAGEPIRMPLGFMADLSPGQVFLLTAMEISSRTFSALPPFKPTERISTENK